MQIAKFKLQRTRHGRLTSVLILRGRITNLPRSPGGGDRHPAIPFGATRKRVAGASKWPSCNGHALTFYCA
jgi:hypothetical protein